LAQVFNIVSRLLLTGMLLNHEPHFVIACIAWIYNEIQETCLNKPKVVSLSLAKLLEQKLRLEQACLPTLLETPALLWKT